MSVFLIYAYLFFMGSIGGWILEFFFRKFFSKSNPQHKWVNPGFCEGPYLPMYGFGLCTLYLISEEFLTHNIATWIIIIAITTSMTIIEYISGIISIKLFNLRLWDYRHLWGNVQGIICPLFSFFWGILGAGYFFGVHPFILGALNWLSQNLAFSFFIGFFFGVLVLDASNATGFARKLKAFAKEHNAVILMDNAKAHIRKFNIEHHFKPHFLLFYKSDHNIADIMKDFYKAIEEKIESKQ